MTLDLKNRKGLNPTQARILAKIEEYGWFVTKVAPLVGEHGDCFADSTGLFLRFGQPEIVTFGLPLETMHEIINTIGNQMKRGVKVVPDKNYDDVLEGFSCQFKFVDKSHYEEHLGSSKWLYEGHDFPVLQCFWPDKNGYFPWQAECNRGIRNLQPFLFLYSPKTGRIQ